MIMLMIHWRRMKCWRWKFVKEKVGRWILVCNNPPLPRENLESLENQNQQPPEWMKNYVMINIKVYHVPKTMKEIESRPDVDLWFEAIYEVL